MAELLELAWPLDRVAEAVERLAEHEGMPRRPIPVPAAPIAHLSGSEALDAWVEGVATYLGLEVEPIDADYGELSAMLRAAGPVLLRVPGQDAVWAVLRSRRGDLTLLVPDRHTARVPLRDVRDALCARLEGPARREIDGWLSPLLPSEGERRRATEALLAERLRGARVGEAWLVRIAPGRSWLAQLRAEGIPARGAVLVGAHVASSCVSIGAWWMLGRGALDGRIDQSWLVAWALLLVSAIPLGLLSVWAQGEVAIRVGKQLKRRLLAGALRVEPDLIRREGAGQLLGRAMEAGAIESLALSAGLTSLLAVVEVAAVLMVIGAGPAGAWLAATLCCFVVTTSIAGYRTYRRSLRWTETRRAITHHLVEQMTGHRTRLAQQPPARWHDGEDEALERYLDQSREMDRADLLVQALPQLWLLTALVALAPTFVAGASQASFALGLGGALLGAGTLSKIAAGLIQLAAAAIAWRQVGPLFLAASKAEVVPSPTIARARSRPSHPGTSTAPLLYASDLTFSHPGRPEPVVRSATIRIDAGDRILFEGPSGGGKSTIVSLLAGMRRPSSGLLLLDGLDFHTLGAEGWRRRVAAAPQFHDNHVLSDTFAMNLLMGRRWPPEPSDLRDAEQICRELGLGELLERMPGGILQMVGETGWRLSHGEQSRLFIARALLQGGSVVILDESFAALDPETLDRSLCCVLDRAPTLVVIAHP